VKLRASDFHLINLELKSILVVLQKTWSTSSYYKRSINNQEELPQKILTGSRLENLRKVKVIGSTRDRGGRTRRLGRVFLIIIIIIIVVVVCLILNLISNFKYFHSKIKKYYQINLHQKKLLNLYTVKPSF